jgi:DNA (cytosine-5)-methyltransferase 1
MAKHQHVRRLPSPSELRYLNEAELRRVASFPDDFQFPFGLHKTWQRIGNSVPPNLMKAIATHLRETVLHKQPFSVVSTFSGCGGRSLGYKLAGGKVLLAVEWDDNAADTYKLNFPDTDLYHGDIKELTVEEVLRRANLKVGELDILDGSPPCQGFSTAGKRDFADSRNQLFKEFVRLLTGLRPKYFVMENVSGMVKGKMNLIFRDILQALKAFGYKVKARLLNAMYYGVPQSRQRMIFIGVREDLNIEPSHPLPTSRPITFREAVQGLPVAEMKPELDHVWIDEVSRQTKWVAKAASLAQGQKLVPGVGSSGRIHWDEPSPTVTTPGLGPDHARYVRNSNIHPSQPRTLSIREAARCQSFPDWFRFVDALNNGSQRIGNSVPPLFMKAIAGHVSENLMNCVQT